MAVFNSKDYHDLVLADLRKYAGLMHPVRAGLLERMFVKRARLNLLHPNPDDEFSNPEIGPNYQIVANYVKDYPYTPGKGAGSLQKPLTVEKVTPHGYMLLNGHHRWMAANRLQRRNIPIRIVNITREDEILKAMSQTDHQICVSFDFDEVVMVKDGAPSAEQKPWYQFPFMFKERIREGIPALIHEFQRMGCDVWVYTGGYFSTEYIDLFLRLYHVKVNGIINGLRNKNASSSFAKTFSNRYQASVHCDLEGVTCVNTRSKDYDFVSLHKEAAWASDTITAVKGMEMIRQMQNEA